MRILVIDAYLDSGETLCEVLELDGHELCCVHTGAEALARVQQFQPEAVVTDVVLPNQDGFDVIAALRSRLPATTRFICYTGWAAPHVEQQAMTAGCAAVFFKPNLQPLRAMLGVSR